MRGRANRADCGGARSDHRRVALERLRYTEGVEGAAFINQGEMRAACERFFQARGILPERVNFGANDFRRSA